MRQIGSAAMMGGMAGAAVGGAVGYSGAVVRANAAARAAAIANGAQSGGGALSTDGTPVPQGYKSVTVTMDGESSSQMGPQVGDRVYRVGGGKSGIYGKSWTPNDPRLMANPRQEMGLPNSNTAQYIIQGRITNTDGIIDMSATALDGNPGGTREFRIPDPKNQVFIEDIDGRP